MIIKWDKDKKRGKIFTNVHEGAGKRLVGKETVLT